MNCNVQISKWILGKSIIQTEIEESERKWLKWNQNERLERKWRMNIMANKWDSELKFAVWKKKIRNAFHRNHNG